MSRSSVKFEKYTVIIFSPQGLRRFRKHQVEASKAPSAYLLAKALIDPAKRDINPANIKRVFYS
jgi:hypothetical protein